MDTTLGALVAMPSSRPAVSLDTTAWSAPDWRSRCWFSASRTDDNDVGLGRQFARGQGDQDRGVVTVGGHHDRAGPWHAGDPQHVGPRAGAVDGDQAAGGRGVQRGLGRLDHHDLSRLGPLAEQGGDRGAALGAYPTTTTWSRTFDLQRWILNDCRERSVSTSTVVPISTIRNSTRSGVMTRMLTSLAASVTGTMSP